MYKEEGKRVNPITYTAARFISVLGHPLLVGSLVSALVLFELYSREKAFVLTAFVLVFVTFPLTAWNVYKTRSGDYSNFDVSIRSQRTSMYAVLLGLLSVTCLLAWVNVQPLAFCIGLSMCLVLVSLSFLINFFLKTSLHAATAFFLALGLLELHTSWGLGMLLLAILVSISRLVLKKHSFQEVLSGSLTGTGAGLLLIYWLHIV